MGPCSPRSRGRDVRTPRSRGAFLFVALPGRHRPVKLLPTNINGETATMALDPQVKGLLDAMAANPAPRLIDLPVAEARELYSGIAAPLDLEEIGRAPCRERVCQYI